MDADIGTDVALSFQEEGGCHAIWDQLQASSVPGATTPPPDGAAADDSGHEDSPPLSPGDSPSASGERSPLGAARGAQMSVKLPAPELSALADISKALADVPMSQRERVAMYIHHEGTYLPRLLDCFRQCEAAGDAAGLAHLFTIVKSLIMMNDMTLVDEMMREENFWAVLGCLEYDPEVAGKAPHRDFMRVRPSPKRALLPSMWRRCRTPPHPLDPPA